MRIIFLKEVLNVTHSYMQVDVHCNQGINSIKSNSDRRPLVQSLRRMPSDPLRRSSSCRPSAAQRWLRRRMTRMLSRSVQSSRGFLHSERRPLLVAETGEHRKQVLMKTIHGLYFQ